MQENYDDVSSKFTSTLIQHDQRGLHILLSYYKDSNPIYQIYFKKNLRSFATLFALKNFVRYFN